MMAYFPKEKILFEADSFNPPAQPGGQPGVPVNWSTNLMENIDRLKLDIQRIIPVHYPADGRNVAMPELLKVVGRSQAN